MKRTLKRESKVLEIVRREAIGAGGSFLVRGCSMVICLSGGLQRWRVLTRLHPVFVLAHHYAFSPGDEPASASCLNVVADGRLGIKGPGRPASQPCPAGATQRTCHRRGRGTN